MKKLKYYKFFFLILIIVMFYGLKTINNQNTENIKKDSKLKISNFENNNLNESIEDKMNDINKNIIDEAKKNEIEKLNELKEEEYIFAFFGTDERSNEISRSDIIMILKYMPKLDRIYIMSIPRDTKVEIPGRYKDKINHSYAFGGIDLITLTLEKFLNIKIDYYIKMSFENFKEIINLIGGVEINAIKDYKYPGYIDILKGKQILDGDNALDYVRFRYDESGDFGRINRQQEVLIELINRMQNTEIEESVNLNEEFYSKMKTNLSLDAFSNFKRLISVSEEIEFESEILKTSGKIINGIWYEIYDIGHLKLVKEKLIKN